MRKSNYFLNKSKFNNNLLFWKPTKTFLIISFLIFIVWLIIGPMDWRSVDDYGVFYYFLKKYFFVNANNAFPWNGVIPFELDQINPFKLFIQTLNANRGYGTFPHSWSLIYLPLSIPFLKFGIDATRYASLIIGLLSSILISYLLSSLCLTVLISTFKDNNRKIIEKNRNIIESLSLIFVCLNPEIMIHSATYISYHLPLLTVLLFLNIFASIYLTENYYYYDVIQENEIYIIPQTYSVLILWFSLLLGYQTFLIVFSFIIAFIFLKFIQKKNIKYEFSKILKKIISIRFSNSLIFPIILSIPLLILSRTHFLKLYSLVSSDSSSGFRMEDKALIYQLNFSELTFVENIKNIYHIFSRLSSLSIYPFREGQNISSLIIIILFLIGTIFLFKNSELGKVINCFTFSIISFALVLSLKGNYTLAPTRHNIYLFPCFWIPLIYYLNYLIQKFEYLYKVNKKIIIILPILSIYIIGLNLSNNEIGYTRDQKNILNSFAKKASVFPGSYGQHDLWSLYWTHGNQEWENIIGKECSINNQIKQNNFGFLYGHDEPFKPNDLIQRKHLSEFSDGCIKVEDDIKIIDSYEFYRETHEEMDSQLAEKQGPKSGLFAYLISK